MHGECGRARRQRGSQCHEIVRERCAVGHDHAVHDQLHIAHLHIVAEREIDRQRTAFDDLHSGRRRVRIHDGAGDAHRRRDASRVEGAVIDRLQARRARCDKADARANRHILRRGGHSEARDKCARISRHGSVHDIHDIAEISRNADDEPEARAIGRKRRVADAVEVHPADERGRVGVRHIKCRVAAAKACANRHVQHAAARENLPAARAARAAFHRHLQVRKTHHADRAAIFQRIQERALASDVADRAGKRQRLDFLPRREVKADDARPAGDVSDAVINLHALRPVIEVNGVHEERRILVRDIYNMQPRSARRQHGQIAHRIHRDIHVVAGEIELREDDRLVGPRGIHDGEAVSARRDEGNGAIRRNGRTDDDDLFCLAQKWRNADDADGQ